MKERTKKNIHINKLTPHKFYGAEGEKCLVQVMSEVIRSYVTGIRQQAR